MSTEKFFLSLHEILFIFRVFKPDVSFCLVKRFLLPRQLTKGRILIRLIIFRFVQISSLLYFFLDQ